MQRETVWLVEDEQGIADTLVYMLQQEGFAVEGFERGLPVLDKARQQVPDVMILDVGLPDIQFITLETVPADCVVLTMTHPMFLVANNPAMMCSIKEGMAIQGVRINVPKCPFRYIYKSKHCTHYSYTAYSKLITPY